MGWLPGDRAGEDRGTLASVTFKHESRVPARHMVKEFIIEKSKLRKSLSNGIKMLWLKIGLFLKFENHSEPLRSEQCQWILSKVYS